ncbi:hypothetical protein IFM89_005473 [Coptis chinensis]|uniref:Uncharacterized protein n=1 Tax=Coptis chinensis TaxID=261450 RepID=A0A835I9Z9_9MAGN|nr:hypothetical protein IFM89_005473 [Coptis chinensis]
MEPPKKETCLSPALTISMDSEQPKKESVLKLLDRLDRGLVSNEELRELVTIQLDKRLKWGYKPTNEEQLAFHLEFINSLKNMDISGGNTEMINRELYEVPVPFLKLMFGKALKQSACYFKHQSMTIDEAETAMHDLYCERAQIKDGLTILDIGCGQGGKNPSPMWDRLVFNKIRAKLGGRVRYSDV